MTEPRVRSAKPKEIELVQALIARTAGSVYLEVGGACGGSLWHFGGAMAAGATLLSVDAGEVPAWRSELDTVVAALVRRGFAARAVYGRSAEPATVDAVRRHLAGRPVDVLLIDADHSVQACRLDIEAYVPLVAPGGLVLMHDCGDPNPAFELSAKVQAIIAGLNGLWRHFSAGKTRVMIQQWCGYGGWWQ